MLVVVVYLETFLHLFFFHVQKQVGGGSQRETRAGLKLHRRQKLCAAVVAAVVVFAVVDVCCNYVVFVIAVVVC